MNACDDETEPLGESPDIDTLGAIRRGAVRGILSAADAATATVQLAERQTQALNAIRRIHQRRVWTATMKYYCDHCLETGQRTWPCATIRAIDEAGA